MERPEGPNRLRRVTCGAGDISAAAELADRDTFAILRVIMNPVGSVCNGLAVIVAVSADSCPRGRCPSLPVRLVTDRLRQLYHSEPSRSCSG